MRTFEMSCTLNAILPYIICYITLEPSHLSGHRIDTTIAYFTTRQHIRTPHLAPSHLGKKFAELKERS